MEHQIVTKAPENAASPPVISPSAPTEHRDGGDCLAVFAAHSRFAGYQV